MSQVSIDKVLGEIQRLRDTKKLYLYRPYPKQYQFHAAGREARERLLMKGNRVGGTVSGGFEMAMHLTGRYPWWWPGRKYRRPVNAWVGSETSNSQKSTVQTILLGTEEVSLNHPDVGTGCIPRDHIVKITQRQAGLRDVADQIVVKHFTDGKYDGDSRLTFKTYDQQRLGWQGASIDIVWPDEEPKHDPAIYSEGLARTQGISDGMLFMTFSPLNGMTPVVEGMMKGGPGKHLTTMTLHDAVGGIWPENTPWAGEEWEGHIPAGRVDEIIAGYPEHERETRVMGVPMAGEGRVFPVGESEIRITPLEIPSHWAQIVGIDFGIDHPFAAVLIAHDRDTDTIYVVKSFKSKGTTPAIHAPAIKAWGDWIPVAWPHDGINKDKGSGEQLHNQYRKHGVNLLGASARYQNDKGGGQPVEPIVIEILERMRTGRFKVFAGNDEWFDEFRTYHRKNGVINPIRDDALKATFYAVMSRRYAVPAAMANRPVRTGSRKPILQMVG